MCRGKGGSFPTCVLPPIPPPFYPACLLLPSLLTQGLPSTQTLTVPPSAFAGKGFSTYDHSVLAVSGGSRGDVWNLASPLNQAAAMAALGALDVAVVAR